MCMDAANDDLEEMWANNKKTFTAAAETVLGSGLEKNLVFFRRFIGFKNLKNVGFSTPFSSPGSN